ncbi:tRNA pseudouridine(55) synthase TruB [Candidatus Babeliales bacterium]|nr:tRNA pseudouridine(55) synthase TruB [Candidatus Babeliales bacterium]
MENNNFAGLLLINKPKGISAFGCIRVSERLLPRKTKIGHTGTLDKEANGLMIICIDRSVTKLIDEILNLDKMYKVTAKLGELTTTLDSAGEIIETKSISSITKDSLKRAVINLGKEYKQTPPVYSALKYKGRSLYKLARHKEVSLEELAKITSEKERLVKLYDIKILDINLPFFTFECHVSKGTYVRSLANDIAQQLKTYATTYELTRTQIGCFKLEDAVALDEIQLLEDIKTNLIPLNMINTLLKIND